MNTASCIILTFKEWTNWVTFGLLRNSQRIRAYTGTQNSFNDLLGITPDITHLEDNEFIVAKLRDSYHRYIYQDDYLSLEAVECFYALSQRGKSLLLHTADKMKVIIDVDKNIEEHWDVWCTQQMDIMAKNKAQKFYEIIFFDVADTISEFEKIINELNNENNLFIKNITLFKNSFDYKKRCPESLEKGYYNTKSYGGMATRFLVKKYIIDDNSTKLSEIYEFNNIELDLKKYYDRLKGIQTYTELTKIFFDCNIICQKIILEKIIKKEIQDDIPLLALSMYFHYEMLIDNEKEINLNALKFDLKILERFYESSYPNISYLIVYLLGKKPALSYTMLNTLYYTKKIESLSCIKTEYFETIKSKLPDSSAIEGIGELYDKATKLINNYEEKIKEKFYSEVESEKHEDLTPKSDTTISSEEQITSPQIDDKTDSKVTDESKQMELIENDNVKNGEPFRGTSEIITKIKKLIVDKATIVDKDIKDLTWEELATELDEDADKIKEAIQTDLNIGKIGQSKKIGKTRFEKIIGALEKLEKVHFL